MTAIHKSLHSVASGFACYVFIGDAGEAQVTQTGRNIPGVVERLDLARRITQRIRFSPRARTGYHGNELEEGLYKLPKVLLSRVADALDLRSRNNLAVSCRAIYEMVALPSSMQNFYPATPNFDRIMLSHKERHFEDLRALRLRFWGYIQEGSTRVAPHLWLCHSMPNITSLTFNVGAALSVRPVQSWHEEISTYPNYGFFDIPGFRQSTAKPMPRLTSLKIEVNITRGPYGYLRYENSWDAPSEWLVPAVMFSEGSVLRRCSLEEVQWPSHLFSYFHSLVAFHHKGESLILSESLLEDLVSSAPALKSVWIEAMGFKIEDVGRCSDLSCRLPYVRLQHVAVGMQNSSERFELLQHLLLGGAQDVLVTLTSLRYESSQKAPYEVKSLALGLAAISYRSVAVESQGHPQLRYESAYPKTQRTRISITLNAWNIYRFDDIVKNSIRTGRKELANLARLAVHERFAVRLFESSNVAWSWFPPTMQHEADDSDSDLVATPAGSDIASSDSSTPWALFVQLQELTIWFSSCWETRQATEIGMFDPENLFIDRPAPQVGTGRFPQLHTLILSAGARPHRRPRYDNEVESHRSVVRHCADIQPPGMLSNNAPPWCACDVEGGFPIELRAVEEFVRDCGFPKLYYLRICGLQCVDVDASGPLSRLLDAVEVEFDAKRVAMDVQNISRERTVSHADELFRLLEQP